MEGEITRCGWGCKSELERNYHDHVWGVPVHDDRTLFKMLILEGQQAGLSWSTILSKMDALCAAYDDFDPEKLKGYREDKVAALLQDAGIIRNRLKILAAIHNAERYYALCEKYGSLNDFLWGYVDGKPIVNEWTSLSQIPASTQLSDRISKDLKAMGFKFVGSTIVYAFMQAVGMVNDHLVSCAFRRADGGPAHA
jgi:DNA-3-methyladenine glycosylase I